ncbi:MAG: dTMP kinase [Patescibacteria group bacterium]|nr:dTMP kinase [Patescibacteria group bacterium]MCL5432186.1 dTMP kinase [Patescibacteria group bacterium]
MERLEIENKLWQGVDNAVVGASHSDDHLKRVVATGLRFQRLYGGDEEIITAAAILHDLGRADKQLRGKESALESVHRARLVLEETGFPKEKIDAVCQAISEHDQPEFTPSTIEGKILKEADFLDGFGARGILRTLLWSGERGETMEETMHRLRVKMPARIAGLEFPESKKIAERQYRFVELFLSLLEEPTSLETEKLTGKYIVIEGTSGSGKDVQAEMLVGWYRKQGIKVRLVHEPTPDTKPTLASWRSEIDDHFMDMFFYIADRRRIMSKEILPALRAGETVIDVRSWIDTQVYEAETKQEEALVRFLHAFVPDMDLILWVDVEPEEAIKRIERRLTEENKPFSKFESLAKIESCRKRYREILGKLNNVVKINGMSSPESVHEEILKAVEDEFGSQGGISLC